MFETIRKLKEKPEKERRTMAVLLSAALTIVIFAFWVVNLNRKLSLSGEGNSPAAKQVATPLSALKETFGKAASDIKETWGNLRIPETADF